MLTSVYCAHGVQSTHMSTFITLFVTRTQLNPIKSTQRLYTHFGCQNHCASTIMEIMEWLLGLIIHGRARVILGRIPGGGGGAVACPGIRKGGGENLKAFFCFSIFQGGGAHLRK